MKMSGSTCEIVEAIEDNDANLRMNDKVRKQGMSRPGRVYSIEDDINRLFDSVNIKTSVQNEAQKNPMKRPMRVNSPRAMGDGISESVNLKQALRGLCISQASEMAAMKKRSLKPSSPKTSGTKTINQLHKTVLVEAASTLSINKGKTNLLEISFPGKILANLSEAIPEDGEVSGLVSSIDCVHPLAPSTVTAESKTKLARAPSKDKIVPLSSESAIEESDAVLVQGENVKLAMPTIKTVLEVDDAVSSAVDASQSAKCCNGGTEISSSESCPSSCGTEDKIKNLLKSSPHLRNLVFRKRIIGNRKVRTEKDAASNISHATKGVSESSLFSSPKSGKQVSGKKNGNTATSKDCDSGSTRVNVNVADVGVKQTSGCKVGSAARNIIARSDGKSRSIGKGEFSQSSNSSIGEYSSSTSEESSSSGSSRCCNRPHMSKDMRWESVHSVQNKYGFLGLRHFKLLRRLGSGDIGTVYLAELVGTNCLFALKVMDNEFLARRKKLIRAQTEREILQMLDHPFLPTLYAHFTTDKLSCLVIEYCPGGDLHVIRQKQPGRFFSEQAARFYVAEVLLALQYLHMLGIVYRDLKPENILVRDDGHIMLSDFDLSLRCIVNPTLFRSSSPVAVSTKQVPSGGCSESSCIDPFCLQPTWQVSCFTPRLLTSTSKTWKLKSDQAAQVTPLPQLVAEPTDARSNSFVGTHEYLAPEIVKGEGHGSAVDWWTYGIFLYELLYGKTPFKGSTNEDTLANVVSQPLRFPETPLVSFHAKDLIRGLLMKQPQNRLGFVRGAAEIKQHPFFEGLNWALIRCAVPPERPKFRDVGRTMTSTKKLMSVDDEPIEIDLF